MRVCPYLSDRESDVYERLVSGLVNSCVSVCLYFSYVCYT